MHIIKNIFGFMNRGAKLHPLVAIMGVSIETVKKTSFAQLCHTKCTHIPKTHLLDFISF
jgi:hypothetical protein